MGIPTIGQHVRILTNSYHGGKVIGHFVSEGNLYIIIFLDQGFYNDDKSIFITKVVVHESNIE